MNDSESVAELMDRARALPPAERALLAEALVASLHTEPDPEVEAAWGEEIRRRVAEIDAGSAVLVDGEEAFARIRSSLK